jgi:hypothetical protein
MMEGRTKLRRKKSVSDSETNGIVQYVVMVGSTMARESTMEE